MGLSSLTQSGHDAGYALFSIQKQADNVLVYRIASMFEAMSKRGNDAGFHYEASKANCV